ncbi:unnamed protein product [Citrullus colocynthis]|uniref:Uncharacterized protein n=1 Tax=Citrullus colocynthis TaxID=252529 RepID=A0ABP0Z3I4_9ROSI
MQLLICLLLIYIIHLRRLLCLKSLIHLLRRPDHLTSLAPPHCSASSFPNSGSDRSLVHSLSLLPASFFPIQAPNFTDGDFYLVCCLVLQIKFTVY